MSGIGKYVEPKGEMANRKLQSVQERGQRRNSSSKTTKIVSYNINKRKLILLAAKFFKGF
ncbi:MAG: hypothetical protein QOF02_19 [Blastocatellia bacterium]|jgi:hypothetical protein|nr:hypothetical protein [Blastocatellia bacterium]